MSLKDIAEGWANVVLDQIKQLDPDLKAASKRRLQICHTCGIRSNGRCDSTKCGTHKITGDKRCGCGCILKAKILAPHSDCPLGKW